MTSAVGCGITWHEDSPHRKETDSAWGEGHFFPSVSMLCVTLQNCGRQQWCVNQTSYQEVMYSNNKTNHSSQHTTLAWPRRLESPPTCSKIPSHEGLELLEILLTLSTQNDTLLKNQTKQQKEIVCFESNMSNHGMGIWIQVMNGISWNTGTYANLYSQTVK